MTAMDHSLIIISSDSEDDGPVSRGSLSSLPSLYDLGIVSKKPLTCSTSPSPFIEESEDTLSIAWKQRRDRPRNREEAIKEIVVHIDPEWELHDALVQACGEHEIKVESKKPYTSPASQALPCYSPIRLYRAIPALNLLTEEPFRFGFISADLLVQMVHGNGTLGLSTELDRWVNIHSELYKGPSELKYSIGCYDFTRKHQHRLFQLSGNKFLYSDAIVHVKMHSQTKPWLTVLRTQEAMVGWLAEFVRIASFAPYQDHSGVTIAAQTKGTSPQDLFLKILCEIPQVSEAVAKAISLEYPTLGHLLGAYQQIASCPDRSEQEVRLLQNDLLSNISVVRTKTEKRLGEALSTRIAQVFNSC